MPAHLVRPSYQCIELTALRSAPPRDLLLGVDSADAALSGR